MAKEMWFDSQKLKKKIFSRASRQTLGPDRFPIQFLAGFHTQVVNRLQYEADLSHLPTFIFENLWDYASTPLYDFMACPRTMYFTTRTSPRRTQKPRQSQHKFSKVISNHHDVRQCCLTSWCKAVLPYHNRLAFPSLFHTSSFQKTFFYILRGHPVVLIS
jgi:hypothetical protein